MENEVNPPQSDAGVVSPAGSSSLNRRQWVTGAGALAGAPILAAASGALARDEKRSPTFDYLFFDFAGGSTPYRHPATALPPMVTEALSATDGKLLGLFVPQIGWSSAQAAILLSWPNGDAGRSASLAKLRGAPGLKSVQSHALTPTARPTEDAPPQPGGVYVHRWFVIDPSAIDEFVALSVQGWADFETRFEAKIFGLWAATRTPEDQRDGEMRIFLLTRYKDHAAWEASRDPTTAAMKAFARRQALTRVTWNASTLLAHG
jgi:hypothetical protein